MEQELKDHGKFKDFYQFTFNFAKNPGQKGLGKNHLMHMTFSLSFVYLGLQFPVFFGFISRFRNGYCILEFSPGWAV